MCLAAANMAGNTFYFSYYQYRRLVRSTKYLFHWVLIAGRRKNKRNRVSSLLTNHDVLLVPGLARLHLQERLRKDHYCLNCTMRREAPLFNICSTESTIRHFVSSSWLLATSVVVGVLLLLSLFAISITSGYQPIMKNWNVV